MPAAVAERQAFLWCYLALRMGLIEVVTGILPYWLQKAIVTYVLGVVHLMMQCRNPAVC